MAKIYTLRFIAILIGAAQISIAHITEYLRGALSRREFKLCNKLAIQEREHSNQLHHLYVRNPTIIQAVERDSPNNRTEQCQRSLFSRQSTLTIQNSPRFNCLLLFSKFAVTHGSKASGSKSKARSRSP